MKFLWISLAAASSLGIAIAMTPSAQAGMFTVRPTAICDDGVSFAVTSANDACAADGGVYSYQHVAFVCGDGALVQDPSAPNPCAADQGVSQQIDDASAAAPPQPGPPNSPAQSFPVFPTNR